MKIIASPIGNTEYDVVGVGICAADYISLVARYPGKNEKTVAEMFSRQGGGPVPDSVVRRVQMGRSDRIHWRRGR